MSDTSIAEVRVHQSAEGRKIEILLRPGIAQTLAGGGTIPLSFGDSTVDFEDALTSANAELDGEQVGIVEVELSLLPGWD